MVYLIQGLSTDNLVFQYAGSPSGLTFFLFSFSFFQNIVRRARNNSVILVAIFDYFVIQEC
jgi:hypothetical protein